MSAESRPRFSVLMSVYNHEEYVCEALDSVAAQDHGDYEIVVVDDGSTDGTAARLEEWAREFRATHARRVELLRIPNSGQSAALEAGFARCRGEYICLLDSDDRWLPHKLREVERCVRADPAAGMVGHPLLVIDPAGNRTGDLRPKLARLSEGDLREQVRRTARQVATATSGVTLRSDIFRSLVPMATRTERSGADLYLTFGASLLAPVRIIGEPLGEYRIHPGGQYVQRTMSPAGLARTIRLQRLVARHFGLEQVVHKNPYFARHVFVAAKLEAGFLRQLLAFRDLSRATLRDGSFQIPVRFAMVGFWTACLLAPRRIFFRLWKAFQLRRAADPSHSSAAGQRPQ
jgi:glycosyltransferase involved in cell wall biosynthesis